MIQLNNGRTMKIEIVEDTGEQEILVTIFDEKGNPDSRRRISSGDIVLLYDYYIMKKEEGEQLL